MPRPARSPARPASPAPLTREAVVRRRLAAHGLAVPRFTDPAALVTAMGPVQGQDYLASLWALGVRLPGATEAEVERAVSVGAVLRTHPLRNTVHLVARGDVRWILALTAERQLARTGPRHRELGLDGATFARSEAAMRRALRGGHLERRALAAALDREGIDTAGQRFIHLVQHAELSDVLISGERRGKQLTFALLGERVPPSPPRPRPEALADLARRYFTTRGPATERDFVWWSGLTVADARAAIASLAGELTSGSLDGVVHWWSPASPDEPATERVHLLPAFDEYAVAYRDRSAISDRPLSSGGMLSPIVVLDGLVVGTWRRTLTASRVAITTELNRPLDRAEQAALEHAEQRYASFVGRPPPAPPSLRSGGEERGTNRA